MLTVSTTQHWRHVILTQNGTANQMQRLWSEVLKPDTTRLLKVDKMSFIYHCHIDNIKLIAPIKEIMLQPCINIDYLLDRRNDYTWIQVVSWCCFTSVHSHAIKWNCLLTINNAPWEGRSRWSPNSPLVDIDKSGFLVGVNWERLESRPMKIQQYCT